MDNSAKKLRLHNPRGILIPLFLAALIFGGYLTYYNYVYQKIKTAAFANKGETMFFDDYRQSGFPYRISINIKNPKSGIYSAEEIRLTASPFELENWVIEFVKAPKIAIDNSQLMLEPIDFKSSFRIDLQTSKVSKLAFTFAGMSAKFGNLENFKIGPSNGQYIYDSASDKAALNLDLSGIQTNSKLMGTDLEFSSIVLRGPVSINNNDRSLEIMYGKAQINDTILDEITGNLTIGISNTINGKIEFCIRKIIGNEANSPHICKLKAQIKDNQIIPDFSGIFPNFGSADFLR